EWNEGVEYKEWNIRRVEYKEWNTRSAVLANRLVPRLMSHCCYQKKVKNIFSSFFNHHYLFIPSNLSNNKITEIEDGTFEGAGSVNELHLSANQLDSVRSGMFKGLDGLRMLMLRNNKIRCIHNNSFTGLHNVRLLSLYDNQLTTITPGAFDTLQTLSTL
ncbi:unnamed protein product, partial [Oncorhynchus mykiss]